MTCNAISRTAMTCTTGDETNQVSLDLCIFPPRSSCHTNGDQQCDEADRTSNDGILSPVRLGQLDFLVLKREPQIEAATLHVLVFTNQLRRGPFAQLVTNDRNVLIRGRWHFYYCPTNTAETGGKEACSCDQAKHSE